jgi:phospholipid/cholesterol/gamma-HCH transport system substrate-binding protein
METRAHHVLIGGFALGISVLTLLFAIWLGRYEFDVRFNEYDIVFEGAVAGLDAGAVVRYNGIKVGQVTDVRIDEDNPNNVRVHVRVNADTPVSSNTVATLDTGILTGLSTVQLSAFDPKAQAQPLQVVEGEDYAIIRSQKTGLQELVASAPELIAQGNKLLAQFNQMASSENIEYVSQIVRDIKAVSETLARSSEEIDVIVANAADISQNMKAATKNVENLTGPDAQRVVTEARGAVENLRSLSGQLDGLVKENRPHIRDFSRGGLPQLAMMVQEARELFAALERLAARIESDPGAFLYGKSGAEYEPTGQGGSR